jgi:hypothetical protein
MTTGQFPPPQVPPPQDPYNQSVYPPSYSAPVPPTGYSPYPAEPAKKSGGNAVLIILMIVFALAAIVGWALYMMKNNALNLANTDITNKTNEIAGLNTNLRSANANIDTLTRQLTASKTEATRFSAQVDELTETYICSGLSASDFDFYTNNDMNNSLVSFIGSNFGTVTDYDWTYLTPLTDSALTALHLVQTSDGEIYTFVVYYSADSKTGDNRIYFVNYECYIE